jgi:type 1 glutamine amidotransferase
MKQSIVLLLLIISFSVYSNPSFSQDRVLIYTRNGEGYVHENIKASVKALKKLAREHDVAVDVSDDPTDFTLENLAQYDALIFSNTNNDAFTSDDQRLAFVHYMEAGGRFVGIHSACGSERQWPWFWSMLGGTFIRHAPFQEFDLKVIDLSHPAVSFLEDTWHWDDECYYMNHLNPANHVVLAADLTTVKDEKRNEYPAHIFGDLFPLAWCRETTHGRVFYTALGHEPEDYSQPKFLKHLWGGIQWVLDEKGKIDYDRVTTQSVNLIKSK